MFKEVKIIKKDKRAKIRNLCDTKLRDAVLYIHKNYPDFAIDIFFTNRKPPLELLTSIGAIMTEDAIEFRLKEADFDPNESEHIRSIKPDEVEEFSKIYDRFNPDFYWNVDRMETTEAIWTIFLSRGENGKIASAITMKNRTEIFSMWGKDADELRSLISAVSKHAFENDTQSVIMLAERKNIHKQTALKRTGFKETGYHVGYRINSL